MTMQFSKFLAAAILILAIPTHCITAPPLPPQPPIPPPSLRILPLGDSITYGFLSSTGDGYRLPLLQMLAPKFPQTKYIGNHHSGNMTNNANEGHPGFLIHDIMRTSAPALIDRPNIILLMAGTNDVAFNWDPLDAPWRLGVTIDFCLLQVPESVVIVAQVPPVVVPPQAEARIRAYNKEIPALIAQRQKLGKKVLGVNMSKLVRVGDLTDGIHPTDYGYTQLARGWHEGIMNAVLRGWVSAPLSGGVLIEGNKDASREDTLVPPPRPVISDVPGAPATVAIPGANRTP